MDFDRLKNLSQKITAPAVTPSASLAAPPSINHLIERLKAQEAQEARQLTKARPLWISAAVLFLAMFVCMLCLPSTVVRPSRLLLFGVLAVVYLVNAVLLGRKLRQLAQIDYAASLRSFLDEAETRCQFMRPQERWMCVLGLIVLGVVSGVFFDDAVLRRYVAPDHRLVGIALYSVGYLLVCAAGLFFTYRNWQRDKAALLSEIQDITRELTADEADE
jgi:hypothetical protein